MSEQKPRSIWSTYRREIVVALIIIVLFTLFAGRGRQQGVEFQFEESQMTIIGPSGAPEPVVVDYADIRSISHCTGLELGDCESGLDTASCRFGTWRSDELGRYALCALPSVSEYVVLETAQRTVVFNYEDDDATAHLYTALLELLESKGVEVSANAG